MVVIKTKLKDYSRGTNYIKTMSKNKDKKHIIQNLCRFKQDHKVFFFFFLKSKLQCRKLKILIYKMI